MADLQHHLRPLLPAVVDAFEETVEELALQILTILRIEQREVRVAVHLQPFLLGAGAQEALEVAARMQAHAAPIGSGEQRRLDVLEFRQPGLVVVVDQAVAQRVAVAIGAILPQLVVAEIQRPRHRLAGDHAPGAAVADAVLHGGHLARIPA